MKKSGRKTLNTLNDFYVFWAHSSAWIECWTSNPMVKGSKPFGPIIILAKLFMSTSFTTNNYEMTLS